MQISYNHTLTCTRLPAQGDALISLYHNVVAELEFKLNKLKIAHIAVAVSSRYVSALPHFARVVGHEKRPSA